MAAADGNAQGSVSEARATVSFLQKLQAEPWRFDYFAVLRHLERSAKDRPRIGDSSTLREEVLDLGQDPFMDFPASNIAKVEARDGKPLAVFVKYLGLLGPQGALPLATTEEAYHYLLAQDDAFRGFLTCSTIVSFNFSFALGRMRGRSPSTTVRTLTASSRISVRRSE